jgi:hypothetical protein
MDRVTWTVAGRSLRPLRKPLLTKRSRRCRKDVDAGPFQHPNPVLGHKSECLTPRVDTGRPGILLKPKFNPLEGDSSMRSNLGQWCVLVVMQGLGPSWLELRLSGVCVCVCVCTGGTRTQAPCTSSRPSRSSRCPTSRAASRCDTSSHACAGPQGCHAPALKGEGMRLVPLAEFDAQGGEPPAWEGPGRDDHRGGRSGGG